MSDENRFTFTNSSALENVMLLNASMTDFSYGTHSHEEFSIGVTFSGRQDFYALGEHRKSYPGNIMVFNPGDAHDGASGGACALKYKMLYVHPNQLAPYLEALDIANAEQFRVRDTVFDDAQVRDKILRLAALIDLQETTTSEYETVLFELAEQLVQFQSKSQMESESRTHLLLDRAKEYLQDNYLQEVSLDELSQVACMSKFHFLRRFKAYTGMTPHQYWLNIRINRARQALSRNVPVSDIANQVGFNDLSHFNRRFKPVFGMTPKKYQQLILQR